MIVRLKDGDPFAPLFLFPGAGANPLELLPLAASIRSKRALLGVKLLANAPKACEPASVTSIAEACLGGIRQVQPKGPYCLAGYSFGGVVALEVARMLDRAGQKVDLILLIDSVFHESRWPRMVYLTALAKRAFRFCRMIVRLSASDVVKRMNRQFCPSWARGRSRRRGPAAGEGTRKENDPQSICQIALKDYVPTHFGGKLIVFVAEEEDFACDPAKLWRLFADSVEHRRIPGHHLDLVREPKVIRTVASLVDECLQDA